VRRRGAWAAAEGRAERSDFKDGFTLLEVMIALAILGAALTVLLNMSSADIRASHKAKLLTIATGLARAKMLDLEEELLRTGFQDTAERMEGDFEPEGQPKFAWTALVEKVQLPEAGQLAEGQKEGSTPPPSADDEANNAALLNLSGGSDSGALGASMVQLYFPLIRPVLEQAIRKVTLEVKWRIGADEETLKVIAFYTDTKAIDQAVRNFGGQGGAGGAGGNPPTPGAGGFIGGGGPRP
jgi:general secretion pathway protein I